MLLTKTGMYAYPDIVVVCEPPTFSEEDANVLVNPQIVIEVLSPTTEAYDRGFKFAQYRLQPTLKEIIFVAQEQMRIERYVRQPSEKWELTTFDDPAIEFELGTIAVRIPLARVYRGVQLAQ